VRRPFFVGPAVANQSLPALRARRDEAEGFEVDREVRLRVAQAGLASGQCANRAIDAGSTAARAGEYGLIRRSATSRRGVFVEFGARRSSSTASH